MRYEREMPGDLIHIDTKKLGRISRIGHRISVRRPGKRGASAQAIGPLARRSQHKNPRHGQRPRELIAVTLTGGRVSDHRPAPGLLKALPPAQVLLAEAGYDSDALRAMLTERGTVPVIPNDPTRKHRDPLDETAYRDRNLIERAFCRLKDWRRIATRYDKLATNFASAIAIAAVLTWWT